jgi:hypothetical protein
MSAAKATCDRSFGVADLMNSRSSMDTRSIPFSKVSASPGRGLEFRRLVQGGMPSEELLSEVRRENLRTIAKDLGGAKVLAEKTGKTEGQISHLIGKNATKPVRVRIARQIEDKLGLAQGYLDRVHGLNDKLFKLVRQQVDEALKETKTKLTESKRDELIALSYKLEAQYSVGKAVIRDLVLVTSRR